MSARPVLQSWGHRLSALPVQHRRREPNAIWCRNAFEQLRHRMRGERSSISKQSNSRMVVRLTIEYTPKTRHDENGIRLWVLGEYPILKRANERRGQQQQSYKHSFHRSSVISALSMGNRPVREKEQITLANVGLPPPTNHPADVLHRRLHARAVVRAGERTTVNCRIETGSLEQTRVYRPNQDIHAASQNHKGRSEMLNALPRHNQRCEHGDAGQ